LNIFFAKLAGSDKNFDHEPLRFAFA